MKNLYFYHCSNEDCEKHTSVKQMQRECTMHCSECGCLWVRDKIAEDNTEDPEWWSRYENNISVESVTRTISTDSVTESTSVFFDRKRQRSRKTTNVNSGRHKKLGEILITRYDKPVVGSVVKETTRYSDGDYVDEICVVFGDGTTIKSGTSYGIRKENQGVVQ